MSRARVTITFNDQSEKFIEGLNTAVDASLSEIAKTMKFDLVNLMETSIPTGKVYYADGPFGDAIRRAGKTEHQASAPGEPPTVLSGDLIRAIEHTATFSGDGVGFAAVYVPAGNPNMNKVMQLEFGRAGKYPLEPRPAWGRTIEANKERYKQIAIEELRRYLDVG